MLKKIIIESPGDSEFLTGSQVDTIEFTEVNEKLEEEGKDSCNRYFNYSGYYKGFSCNKFIPVSCFLPGNNKGSDRCRY